VTALGGDLNVARIGYGAMKLTGWPRGDRPDRDTALAVLRRAVELGVNHIDTATAGIHLDAATMATPDELATVAS
jgi:aryl-alcohol dehydrogenase-like predicted oxidoreductase